MTKKEEIMRVLAPTLRPALRRFGADLEDIEEIRLRISQPLALTCKSQSLFLNKEGNVCQLAQAYKVTAEEVKETVNLLSSYSRYAFEDKIRQGFLTIQGGHRVGLAGRVIPEQGCFGGAVKTISPITCVNIRIARQVVGCGEAVLSLLWRGEKEKKEMADTMLVSPPGVGKTTLLRDLIRLVSYDGMNVGVVDERSELAACWQGIPQNDLGPRTDVLDSCSKAEGMMMLVRSMAPQIIAVDELGGEKDCLAMEYAMHCGCRILATAHGSGWEDIRRRPILGRLIEQRCFDRYVFLQKKSGETGVSYQYCVCDSAGEVIARIEEGGHGKCRLK